MVVRLVAALLKTVLMELASPFMDARAASAMRNTSRPLHQVLTIVLLSKPFDLALRTAKSRH